MEKDVDKLNKKESTWKPVILFYAKTTSWIVIPLVVGILIGKKVAPEYLFLFMIVSFGITCFGIYKEIKQYQKEIKK